VISLLSEVSAYRFSRAAETFDEAKELAASEHWNGALNRLYYACFYAVSAWLAYKGFSSSKHTGIRSLFNRQLIQTHILTNRQGALYNDLFELRQEGDYEDFVRPSRDDVEPLVPEVGVFIGVLRALWQQEMASE
jgi:uncharacterized protein (UPF0332 family)